MAKNMSIRSLVKSTVFTAASSSKIVSILTGHHKKVVREVIDMYHQELRLSLEEGKSVVLPGVCRLKIEKVYSKTTVYNGKMHKKGRPYWRNRLKTEKNWRFLKQMNKADGFCDESGRVVFADEEI